MGEVISIHEISLQNKIRKIFNLDKKHSIVKSFKDHPAFYVDNEEYNNHFTYLVGIDRNKNVVVMGFAPGTPYEDLNSMDLYKYLDKGVLVKGTDIPDWLTWCLGENYSADDKKNQRFIEDTLKFYYTRRLDEVFEPDVIPVDFKPFLDEKERAQFELDPSLYKKWDESHPKYLTEEIPSCKTDDDFENFFDNLFGKMFGGSFDAFNIGDIVKINEESTPNNEVLDIDTMCKEFAHKEFPGLTDDEIESIIDIIKAEDISCFDEDEE